MSQSRANRPDTPADILLRQCLLAHAKQSFTMVAGAGSGKTTSLVKALTTIIEAQGVSLKRLRQRVACITYTEVAAQEIWADVGNNPQVHVSTIHSFLWMITRTFQSDIRAWVQNRIDDRIADLNAAANGFGPRVQQRTRDTNRRDVARLEASKEPASSVATFTYGTGSNYGRGILGHDDIIRIATDFLSSRPLFRTVLAQQFPYIFVDESQDTQNSVVEALLAVDEQAGAKFCLGFFGDPMQRIYAQGIGNISARAGWAEITKPENFRCPAAVLTVANAIRNPGDNLVQHGGRTEEVAGVCRVVEGTARIFILQADTRRDELVQRAREFVARENDDPAWRSGPDANVKMLVIVHRMAALRLGFGDLYSSMNDKAPSNFSDGFLDGTAWPIRPFVSFVLPLIEATQKNQEFEAMALLRTQSPLLNKLAPRTTKLSASLAGLRAATQQLLNLMTADGGATVRDVLVFMRESQLLTLDPKMLAYLDDANGINNRERPLTAEEAEVEAEDGAEIAREIAAIDAFLACPAKQFIGYLTYIQQESPFSTQQGIKGAEFERVLVVVDDEEGTHVQFSYDKYFGVKELSKNDLKNLEEGKETSVERTRRLFYVCCTRALSDLVVIYFATDPVVAERQVRASEIFNENSVFTESSI